VSVKFLKVLKNFKSFKNFKCECEELTSVCTQDGKLIVIEGQHSLAAQADSVPCMSVASNYL
jgi:hypothetical protein